MSAGKGKMPEPRNTHINVTPMIDLLMCLIIFFLLASKLATDDTSTEVILPKIKHSKELTDQERLEQRRLTINIAAADPQNKDAERQKIRYIIRSKNFDQKQLLAEMKRGVAEDKNLVVAIRPDGRIRYDEIQPVLISAGQANVKSVIFGAGIAAP